MNLDDILDAWRVNDQLNLKFLDACTDEDLELKPGKGKTIRSNLVHLVLFRRSWVEIKLRKESAKIPKLDWKTAGRAELREALKISSTLMEDLFRIRAQATKSEGWTDSMFFAYTVAHEANHRAQIELALRLNGREPDVAFLYGLWDWPKISSALQRHPESE